MEVDHRLLHRMQFSGFAAEVLDRHDMAAVERAEEADAGVDAFVDELAGDELADQHSAGAAIALRAAFLGPAQRAAQPQIVEQRLAGSEIGERDVFAVENEAQLAADLWLRHAQLPL